MAQKSILSVLRRQSQHPPHACKLGCPVACEQDVVCLDIDCGTHGWGDECHRTDVHYHSKPGSQAGVVPVQNIPLLFAGPSPRSLTVSEAKGVEIVDAFGQIQQHAAAPARLGAKAGRVSAKPAACHKSWLHRNTRSASCSLKAARRLPAHRLTWHTTRRHGCLSPCFALPTCSTGRPHP